MASAGTVTIDFAAETAKFTAELKKVQSSLKSMQSDFGAFTDVIGRAGSAFAGILSVGSIAAFATQVFNAADAMGDAAARAGVAVDSLSRLAFAANQSDVEFGSLTTGIRGLQKSLVEASLGTGEAAEAFKRLGLRATELRGLQLEDQFARIADAFQNIIDPAERTALALKVFGKAGQDLVPLLSGGSEAIRRMARESDELGNTLTVSAAAGVAALDSALKKLKGATLGNAANLLGENALFFFGPGDDNPISKVTQRIISLKKARDSLITAGAAIGVFDAKQIEEYNKQIAAAEAQIISLQNTAQATAAAQAGRVGAQAATQAALAEADAILKKLQEQAGKDATKKSAEDDRLQQELRNFKILRDARRLDEQERIEAKRRENQLLIEVDREGLIARVTQENEIFQQQVQYQSDLSALLAQVRRNLGLDEINWEQIKSQSILEIATQLFTGMSGVSKKFAKVQQGIALAQAVWYTASGVANALRSVPFPANLVAAAKVAAFGAVQIAKIKSTSFDNPSGSIAIGGGVGGSDALNKTDVGETVATGATAKAGTTVYISGFISRNTIDELVTVLRDEVDRDVTIFGSNSRQAFDTAGLG